MNTERKESTFVPPSSSYSFSINSLETDETLILTKIGRVERKKACEKSSDYIN